MNNVIPESFYNYDKDKYEVLCNQNQYLFISKEETDSTIIRLVDIYNTLTMIHSIENDIEVVERYKVPTSKAIAQMNCNVLHNAALKKRVLQMRKVFVQVSKSSELGDKETCYQHLEKVYDLLNEVLKPLISATEEDYWKMQDRVGYLNDFEEYKSMRGAGNQSYKKQLLAAYAGAADFDMKCIWALEFAHSDSLNARFPSGAALLEEVMLSDEYSPYLDEVWATWRAMVSTVFPPSNYGYIPNLFYNQMRLHCATTILQHIKEKPTDQLAQALFINIAGRDNIVRHGFILGNSSMLEQMNMFPEWGKE